MSVWDAVTGQEGVITQLIEAATDPAAMTHAWLITGPPGSGRSVAARAFAAALQCPQGGCGQCHECSTVLAGTHGDVTFVATENVTISVAEVRELVGAAARLPSIGRWRAMVVEDADRMTERTSNVLLKAIEEPPARTVWILVAPSPQDVIVTIRSRCRQVGLRIPSVEAVTELLIAQDGVDSTHAREAAMAAQCHIGVARRLARDPQARARRERVLSLPLDAASVGQAVIAAGELVDLAQAEAKADGEERDRAERAAVYKAYGVEEGDRKAPAAIRQQIDQFSKRAKDDSKRRATRSQRDQLDRAMVDLLSFYRDVLSVQTRSGVALINTAHAAEISQMANTTATAATLRAIDVVGEARVRLLGNAAPALTVEAMAVGLALAGESGR